VRRAEEPRVEEVMLMTIFLATLTIALATIVVLLAMRKRRGR
jgi:hypothetical protein